MAITTAELITKLRAGEKVASAAYDPAKQAAGYTKRLEGAGVDVASATDDRGWLGKFLNLNQNQGFLGDVFEVIDRPLNAFTAALMGEDAWDSFTGKAKTEYTYIDVFKHYGMDDITSAGLGLAANIWLDPMNLVTFGVGQVVKAGKTSLQLATKADSFFSVAKTLFGSADEAAAAIKAYEQGGKILDNAADVSEFLKDVATKLGKTDVLKDVTAMSQNFMGTYAKLAGKNFSLFAQMDEISRLGKNMGKGDIKEYNNFFGKMVKGFQNMNPLRNPLKYYDMVQDLGTSYIMRGVSKTLGITGKTFKAIADSGVNKMFGAGTSAKLWQSVDDAVAPIKRLFGFFDEQSAKALSKLQDLKARALGDVEFQKIKTMQSQLEASGLLLNNTIDAAFEGIMNEANSTNPAIRQILVGKGDQAKSWFLTAVNTMQSEMVNNSLNIQEALMRQHREANIIYEADGKTIDIVKTRELNPNLEIHEFDPVTGEMKISEIITEKEKYGGVKDNVEKNREEFINGVKYNPVDADGKPIKNKSWNAKESKSSGASAQGVAGSAVENQVKAVFGDVDTYTFTGRANASVGFADTQVYIKHVGADGKEFYIKVAEFEVKSTGSFILGRQGKRSGLKAIATTTYEKTLYDESSIEGVIANRFIESLKAGGQVSDDTAGVVLMDGFEKIANDYLSKHKDILWTIDDGNGGLKTYYMSKESMIEAFRDMMSNNALNGNLITLNTSIAGGKTVKVKNYKAEGFATYTRKAGTKAMPVTELANVRLTDAGVEHLKKYVEANHRRWVMDKGQKTMREFLDLDSGEEIALDEIGFNKLSEAVNKYNARVKDSENIDLLTIFDKTTLGNGKVKYTLMEDQKKALKALLDVKNKDPGFARELNALLETLVDRPSFIDSEMLRFIDDFSLNNSDDFSKIQKSYTDLMDGYKKAVDQMGSFTSTYGQQFGSNYVRHARDKNVADVLKKNLQPDEFDTLFSGGLTGKINSLNSRRYNYSVYETNLILDEKLRKLIPQEKYKAILGELGTDQIKIFTEDLNKSALDFFMSASAQKTQSTLLDAIVSEELAYTKSAENPNPLIRELTPEGKMIGYEVVSKKQLSDQVNAMAKYMSPEQSKIFKENHLKMINTIGGNADSVLMDTNVFNMIGRLGEPEPLVGAVGKIFDWGNGIFKQTKLMSPGFLLRNLTGNFLNLSLSGMPVQDLMAMSGKFPDYWRIGSNGPSLVAKVAEKGLDSLSPIELEEYELFSDFVRSGFLNSGYGLNEIEDMISGAGEALDAGAKKGFIKKLTGFTAAGNEATDRMFRLALLDYARKNPAIYMKAGFETPAQFVRFTLFDPKDLTGFEKDVMRRIMPFYTFTKKNLMYHLANFSKNPIRYAKFNRVLDASYTTVGAAMEDAPEYQVENMYIPIPFLGADGKFTTFKANLPQSDLNEWINDPLKRLMGSFTPLLRAPFELSTNTQIYTGMPIQEYEGQKGFKLPYLDRTTEYLLSQTGVDVPLGVVSDVASGDFAGALGFGQTDTAKAQLSRDYDQLKELQNLMKYYKQQGVRIPTIAELENQGQMTKLDQMLAAING